MMIEAYAFLAAFVTQILAMSVLLPAWFTRYVRARLVSFPAERLAQLYPGIDIGHAQERFLAQYRALNTAVALLGLLFLGWFFSYMQRPEWDEGKVNMLVTLYLFLQAAQWGFVIWFAVRFKIAWFGIRFNALHERALLESKRKAVLQRRGLFDLVSPFAVFLTALVYLLFVAFVIYIQQHPFRGFAGAPGNIGIITLLYAWNAFMVYRFLHGKKINPLETQAEHLHLIGLYVKTHVYGCIAVVFFLSLGFAFKLFDLEKWGPFGHSVFFVILTLITCMTLILPPRNNQQRGGPDMLKVILKIWSYSFSVTDGAESVAQAVDLSWWRDKGELQVQGVTYTARRDKSSYILELADEVLVRAERPRKLFRQFLIKHAGRQYTLRAKSALRREFRLLEGSAQVGSIAPEGLFTRKASVDLAKKLPLFLQVFIIWLAMMQWKHEMVQ